MRTIKIIMIVFMMMLGGMAYGISIHAEPPPLTFIKSNAISVNPSDTLQDKYDWLKSSDRDTKMGDATATNRRCLSLTPGTYSQTLTVDTDFIDIYAVNGGVIIVAADDATIEQTADDVHMYNFTVKTTGEDNGHDVDGDVGLLINANDNSASRYIDMKFIGTAYQGEYGMPVFGQSNLGGYWRNCDSTGYAWRVAEDKELNAYMVDCIAWQAEDSMSENYMLHHYQSNVILPDPYGHYSFGGDRDRVKMSGTFIRCISGDKSFAGCSSWGADSTGTFIDCIAGLASFSPKRNASGLYIRCHAGDSSFGGFGQTHDGLSSLFTGYAIDCVAGSESFGMGDSGHTEGICAGTIINCRVGSVADYNAGITGSGVYSTFQTSVTTAEFTTDFVTGANSNITLTAIATGSVGNRINFEIVTTTTPDVWTCAASKKYTNRFTDQYRVDIVVVMGDNLTKNGNDLETLIDDEASAYVTTQQIGTGDSNIDASMDRRFLLGGLDKAYFRNNHPYAPTNCTASRTIAPFDNGHTYTNGGATGAITLTLPEAMPGLEYHFVDVEDTATRDITLDGDGSEEIGDWGTTLVMNSDEYESVTITCRVAGSWLVKRYAGIVVNGSGGITVMDDKDIILGGTGHVTSGSEGFIIGSANIVESELEMIDGVTAGTGAANKALVLDGDGSITAGVTSFSAGIIVPTNGIFSLNRTNGEATIYLYSSQDNDAVMEFYADEADDDDDKWRIFAEASTGNFVFEARSFLGWQQRLLIDHDGNTTIDGTLTVNGDQSGAEDSVFDDYNDIELLEKWRAGEKLPFPTGDMLRATGKNPHE